MERERTHTRHTRKTPLKVLAGGLLAGILFAACQGDNLFVDFNTTGQIQDADIPTVEIVVPSPLSVAAIPLGDSVLITVDLSDEVKSRVVCKSERKLLDASVRLPWRPPSVREA